MRFAKMTGAWLDVCEPPVLDAFDAFCKHLQEFGFTVQETPALGWNDANEIRQHVTAYEAFQGHRQLLDQHRAEYDPIILKRLEFGGTLSHETYTQYLTRQELFSWKLDDAFYEVDFLLAPTVPVSKVLPGEYANDGFLITLTSAASVAGLPVLTVPWSENQHKGGIGFQIMARKEHDAALFVLADKLSKCY